MLGVKDYEEKAKLKQDEISSLKYKEMSENLEKQYKKSLAITQDLKQRKYKS